MVSPLISASPRAVRPEIIRQEATWATIAMFPDGTRVAVYDNGRVKVGRDNYRVNVDRTFNYGRGQ